MMSMIIGVISLIFAVLCFIGGFVVPESEDRKHAIWCAAWFLIAAAICFK